MLILHIGTHKTGTTSLQATLARAGDALLAHGIRYVEAGREGRLSHNPLAWAIRGRRNTDISLWQDVREELADSRATHVLSSEGFWFEDPAVIRAQLPDATEARVVVYLRRQDQYLQSLYKQTVSSGRKVDFDTWMGEMGYRGDYLTVLRKWAAAFGRDAIVVRPYERNGRTIDVIEDFLDVLGVDPHVLEGRKVRASNPSPRREVLHFLRAFNQLGLKVDHDKLFYSIIKRQKSYIRSADLLSHAQCIALMERYAADNAAVAEEFCRNSAGPLFPALAEKSKPEIWSLDDPEFFGLTVDVIRAIVNLLEGQEIVRKKRDNAPPP